MAIERTFSIVKPDAVSKNLIGEIYHRMESAGLTIVAAKMLRLTSDQAAGFYAGRYSSRLLRREHRSQRGARCRQLCLCPA